MKTTILVTLLSGVFLMASANAEEKTLTPQQQRMTTCNQQANSQSPKGDARKTYMSDCLQNGDPKPEGKSPTPQQHKIRARQAKRTKPARKGEDRTKFLSACR